MTGIAVRQAPPHLHLKEALCRVFAEHGLNMTFLSTRWSAGKEDLFCCLSREDRHAAQRLIEQAMPASLPPVRIIPSVALLSVFPHQSDMRLLGRLLHGLWEARIPLHALASSIASLTVVVDAHRRKHAVAALETCLGIQPEDHLNER